MITSRTLLGRCRICDVPGHACGDDHVRGAPLDNTATAKDDNMEMREYEYMVGNLPHTAMLTEKMAQRLNAKPVGSGEDPDVEFNRTAERMSTQAREADDDGIESTSADGSTGADALAKARTARNKRPA